MCGSKIFPGGEGGEVNEGKKEGRKEWMGGWVDEWMIGDG